MSQLSSSPRSRGRASRAALAALAVAAFGSTAIGHAQGRPPDPDGGGYRTVYHATYAYSTPHLTARSQHVVRPGSYFFSCEGKSTSTGRYYNNLWWSKTNEGTWINNGDLKGGVKMGLGDCPAPRSDG